MEDKLLQVKNVTVSIEDKKILKNINLNIGKGETHVLMGPNGAGKSTLGYVLMGSPSYNIDAGEIFFKGENITNDKTENRAKAGMFLSFQEPIEVPGLSLESFIRNAYVQRTGKRIKLFEFKKQLDNAMNILQMDRKYA